MIVAELGIMFPVASTTSSVSTSSSSTSSISTAPAPTSTAPSTRLAPLATISAARTAAVSTVIPTRISTVTLRPAPLAPVLAPTAPRQPPTVRTQLPGVVRLRPQIPITPGTRRAPGLRTAPGLNRRVPVRLGTRDNEVLEQARQASILPGGGTPWTDTGPGTAGEEKQSFFETHKTAVVATTAGVGVLGVLYLLMKFVGR